MKSKISHNLISFVAIRRGNWILKISVYKKQDVLLVAQHFFDKDRFIIKHFSHHDEAADYINLLVEKEE